MEKLIHKHKLKAKSTSGKELPKLDIGTPVLYDKNPDSTKIKRPKWCKGTIKNRQDPQKYEILADDSDSHYQIQKACKSLFDKVRESKQVS